MPDDVYIRELPSGHTLLPGLIDPHLHILPTVLFHEWVNLSPFEGQNLRQNYHRRWVAQMLKEKLQSIASPQSDSGNAKNQWLTGKDVDPSLMQGSEKVFDSDFLDAVTKEYPVIVTNASMHFAYVNSKAMEIARNTADFALNSDELDSIQKNKGVLKETEQMEPFIGLVSLPTDQEFFGNLKAIMETASSRGVTYMMDAGVQAPDTTSSDQLNQVEILNNIAHQADCPVRVGGALVARSIDEFNKTIADNYSPGWGDSQFHLPFVKLIADGSNQGLSGFQFDPYACDLEYKKYDEMKQDSELTSQQNVGLYNYGYPVQFNALVQKVSDYGWSMMVHANGDHAISRTINGFEQMTKEQDRRHRIEHCSLLSDTAINDMARLSIYPSFLIGHVGYWGWEFQNTIFTKEKSQQMLRCRSALNKGLRISLHSDNGVSPVGPLRMMEQAVTRIMEGSPDNRKKTVPDLSSDVMNEAERISRFEALKAVTYDAAWQCYADHWVGSLEVGKCADFVILEESPLNFSASDLYLSAQGMRNINVLETWKGGRKVFSHKQ